jgi:hypothetical protein
MHPMYLVRFVIVTLFYRDFSPIRVCIDLVLQVMFVIFVDKNE